MRRLRPPRPAAAGFGALLPLVDVVTLLLVFLLRAWSADPPLDVGEAGFRLPETASTAPVPGDLALDVGRDGIWLGGARVASSAWVLGADDLLVPELDAAIRARAPRALVVRADEQVPYGLLRRVLFTAREAGVADLSLVARSRAGL